MIIILSSFFIFQYHDRVFCFCSLDVPQRCFSSCSSAGGLSLTREAPSLKSCNATWSMIYPCHDWHAFPCCAQSFFNSLHPSLSVPLFVPLPVILSKRSWTPSLDTTHEISGITQPCIPYMIVDLYICLSSSLSLCLPLCPPVSNLFCTPLGKPFLARKSFLNSRSAFRFSVLKHLDSQS